MFQIDHVTVVSSDADFESNRSFQKFAQSAQSLTQESTSEWPFLIGARHTFGRTNNVTLLLFAPVQVFFRFLSVPIWFPSS